MPQTFSLVLWPPDAALFNPLLSCAGNRTNEQKRAAIAALCIGHSHVNAQVLTPQRTTLPDEESKRTCVLFCSFHTHGPTEFITSEIYLQSELNDSRVCRRKNAPECCRFPSDIRRSEVRTVKCIEQLRSELQVAILIEANILRH